MRDPKRIDEFCDELKKMWHRVPDWRFGQLMSNFLGEVSAITERDIFFIEDDEMLEYVAEYQTPEGNKKNRTRYVRRTYEYALRNFNDDEEIYQWLLDICIKPEEVSAYVGREQGDKMKKFCE